jgi:hypothetical protein
MNPKSAPLATRHGAIFLHPSNFRPCLWFLAKNKNADAKRGFQVCPVENHNALAA